MERAVKLIEESDVSFVQFKHTRQLESLGDGMDASPESISRSDVYSDILRFNIITSMVWGKLYRTSMMKDVRFNEACHVLEDVEILTRIMQNCTCVSSAYIAYYYRPTPGSLITQGLNIRKLLGSIACQNSCIQMLQGTDLESRSYQFKYESLFNWLVRTAKQDDWHEFYQRIGKQVIRDLKQMLHCHDLNIKTKTTLIACAVAPRIAHTICCRKSK